MRESLTSGFKSLIHHLLCEDRKQRRGSEDDPSFGSTQAGGRTEVQPRRRFEQSCVFQHENKTEKQWSKTGNLLFLGFIVTCIQGDLLCIELVGIDPEDQLELSLTPMY